MDHTQLITNAFVKSERKKLWIPRHIIEKEDLEITPVITWMHNKLPLGFMLYNDGYNITGITLSPLKMKYMPNRPRAAMCDLCKGSYSASKIALFSFTKGQNISISFYICSDLDCEERIMDPKIASNLYSTRETSTKAEKIIRYHENVAKLFQQHVLDRARS